MVEVIVEYSNERVDKNIRALFEPEGPARPRSHLAGKIKYHLPIINSYVLEVDERDVWRLHSVIGVSSLHKTATISAQMNQARQTVKADVAHALGFFGRGITIAVLDTGLAPVDDLAGIVAFKDFINERDLPYDDNGHGTHVRCR